MDEGTLMQNVLVGLDVVQNGLLVVEGTIGLGERAALSKWDANARRLDDGARRSKEGKGHRNEGRFAEHLGGAGEGWRERKRAGNRTCWRIEASDEELKYSGRLVRSTCPR